jgi:hypothetical protein
MSDLSSNEPELRGPEETTTNMGSQNKTLIAQNCYPSPDRSPFLMPAPAPDASLTEGSEDDDDILPATLAGRKRRLSSSQASQTMTSELTTRQVKRPWYVDHLLRFVSCCFSDPTSLQLAPVLLPRMLVYPPQLRLQKNP